MANENKTKIDPELLLVISELTKQNQAGLIEAIKELKKPDEETLAKKKREQESRASELRARLEAEVSKSKGKWALMNACPHMKDGGHGHTWGGQVLSGNGDAIAICCRCEKDFRWQATQQQMMEGLNLESAPLLSEQTLASWEQSRPPKIRAKRHFWKELAEKSQ